MKKNLFYKFISIWLHYLKMSILINCLEFCNKDNNTVKIKPIDVKSSTYIDFDKENNDWDPKFNVVDHVRISNYKNIFAKDDIPNCSEEVFAIKKS